MPPSFEQDASRDRGSGRHRRGTSGAHGATEGRSWLRKIKTTGRLQQFSQQREPGAAAASTSRRTTGGRCRGLTVTANKAGRQACRVAKAGAVSLVLSARFSQVSTVGRRGCPGPGEWKDQLLRDALLDKEENWLLEQAQPGGALGPANAPERQSTSIGLVRLSSQTVVGLHVGNLQSLDGSASPT